MPYVQLHVGILVVSAGDAGKCCLRTGKIHQCVVRREQSMLTAMQANLSPPSSHPHVGDCCQCFSSSQICTLKKLLEVPLAPLSQETLH